MKKFELTNKHLHIWIATLIVAFFFCSNPHINAQSRQIKRQERLELKYDSAFKANHSSVKATLYSAVLPGLGQIYNRKVWKAPIIYSLIAGNIYFNRYSTKQFNLFKLGYADLTLGILNEDLLKEHPELAKYNVLENPDRWIQTFDSRKEYYQRLMHISIITFGAIYMLNILDANIDAEFLEYDVSQDLTLKLLPSIIKNDFSQKSQLGLTCSLRF